MGPVIGLVTGAGQFPCLVAQSARAAGYRVVMVAHEGQTTQETARAADVVAWVKFGQLQKTISFLVSNKVSEVVLAGALTKADIFANFEPDQRALDLAARLPRLSDDAALRGIAAEFEKDGIQVRPSTLFNPELLAPEGIWTIRQPSLAEMADVELGWDAARTLGRLDIGQSVIVRDRTILAVEAVEGTDAAIRRGGELGREKMVVVKVCKPAQDTRFDMPTVGLTTVLTMIEARASLLAIEADRTLVFDRDGLVAAADQAGLCILARRGN